MSFNAFFGTVSRSALPDPVFSRFFSKVFVEVATWKSDNRLFVLLCVNRNCSSAQSAEMMCTFASSSVMLRSMCHPF